MNISCSEFSVSPKLPAALLLNASGGSARREPLCYKVSNRGYVTGDLPPVSIALAQSFASSTVALASCYSRCYCC